MPNSRHRPLRALRDTEPCLFAVPNPKSELKSWTSFGRIPESELVPTAGKTHRVIIGLDRRSTYRCQPAGGYLIVVILLSSSSDEVTVAHIPIEGLIKEMIDTPPNLVISETRDKPKLINAIHAPGETPFPEAADVTKTIHDATEKE